MSRIKYPTAAVNKLGCLAHRELHCWTKTFICINDNNRLVCSSPRYSSIIIIETPIRPSQCGTQIPGHSLRLCLSIRSIWWIGYNVCSGTWKAPNLFWEANLITDSLLTLNQLIYGKKWDYLIIKMPDKHCIIECNHGGMPPLWDRCIFDACTVGDSIQ